MTTHGKRPGWIGVLDRLSVVLSLLAWAAVTFRFASVYSDFPSGVTLIASGIVGYALADMVSGMVHWLADRYFEPTTPILGPALIAPFREHHADEIAMTQHDFFEISGNNGLATIPLAVGLLLLPQPLGLAMKAFIATLSSLGLSIIATNQFHCWAHVAMPPKPVRYLQRWGLILSPEQHAMHHQRQHDRCYCVTSGWLNPLFDRMQLFLRLEHRIQALTGKSPGPRGS